MNDTAGDQDIDLLAMILILWRKKVAVVLWGVVFLLISGLYVIFAPEKWVASAELTMPTIVEAGEYMSGKEQLLQLIDRINSGEREAENADEQTSSRNTSFEKLVSDELFERFKLVLRSGDFLHQFFAQSKYYTQTLKQPSGLGGGKNTTLKNIAKKFLVEFPSQEEQRNQTQIVKLRFTYSDPNVAESLLQDYLSAVNHEAYEEDKNNFLLRAKQYKKQIEALLSEIEAVVKSAKNNQLKALSNALSVAQRSGLVKTDPALNGSVLMFGATQNMQTQKMSNQERLATEQPWLFLFGSRFLQAQLDVVAESELNFPPAYYLLKNQEEELESIITQVKKQEVVSMYRQLSSPQYTLSQKNISPWLILSLATLLGLFFGAIVVLIRDALCKKQDKF